MLPTVCDDELLHRSAPLCAQRAHLLHHIHALLDPPESHMLEVQVLCLLQGDEELRAVCVTPAIGHGQDSRACVLHVKVLVFKLAAVDGLASTSVAFGEIAALKDELERLNHDHHIEEKETVTAQSYPQSKMHRFTILILSGT